jgi:hypothetical protein
MSVPPNGNRSPRKRTAIELASDKRQHALLSLRYRNFGNAEDDEFDLADAEYRSWALHLGYPPLT